MWKLLCPRCLSLLLWFVVPAALAGTDAAERVDPRAGVCGTWESAKGTVFVIEEVAGGLRAEVVAMRKPRLDKKNPDPELRDRPLIGLQLLSDYRFKHGVWRGRFYDPSSGRTFRSRIKLDKHGDLGIRGYVGISLFGKTEVFRRVSECSEPTAGLAAWETSGEVC
jgi:uncharacterized protein (DUF2147 family)